MASTSWAGEDGDAVVSVGQKAGDSTVEYRRIGVGDVWIRHADLVALNFSIGYEWSGPRNLQ